MDICKAVAKTLAKVVTVCETIYELACEVKSQPAKCKELARRVKSVQPALDLLNTIVQEDADVAAVCESPLQFLLDALEGKCVYICKYVLYVIKLD